jgi:hypothetical protein
MRLLRGGVVAIALLCLAGCVHMTAPGYQPGVANTETLLRTPGAKIAVDAFSASDASVDGTLSIRGSGLAAGDGHFSTYLHDAAVQELRTAGRLDTDSPVRLSGQLTRNELDSGASMGHSIVAARFVVMRNGSTVYDKPVQIQHDWESSFIGAIAIPAAVDNYVASVQLLLGRLFEDPDFVRATAPAETR